MEKRQIKRIAKNKADIEPVKLEKLRPKESALDPRLMKAIAIKTGLTEDVVKEICRSQWTFLAEVMRENKYYSFRIKFLGIFGVKNLKFLYTKNLKDYFVRKEERVRGIKPELLAKEKLKNLSEEIRDKDIDLYATEY